MSTVDENLLAVWEVAGENFKELYDNALEDAQLFMGTQEGWRFFVMACHPIEWDNETHNSAATMWKGQGIIKWIENNQ